jgi:hypothetical protein
VVDGAELLVTLPGDVDLVQQDTHGRRGHKHDPLYKIRGLLRHGVEQLTERQQAKISRCLDAGDPRHARRRTSSTTCVPNRTTWKASNTATASGRPSWMALWSRVGARCPAFLLARFPDPLPEPDVRFPPHPALREVMPGVSRRRWLSPAVVSRGWGWPYRDSGSGSPARFGCRTVRSLRPGATRGRL